MSSLYSAMLLVHLNSKQHTINVLIPRGSIIIYLDPTPSFDLEPSKWKVQKLETLSTLVSLGSIMLQSISIV